MKKNKKNKKAFSLMELLIIIALITITTGIALAFVGSNKGRTELEAAANEVVSNLRETQNYALTGKSAIGDNCVKYEFHASSNSSDYSMIGYDEEDVVCGFNIDYHLSGKVEFDGDVSISFSTPHGDVNAGNITLKKEPDNYYHVCINSAGLITKSITPCP